MQGGGLGACTRLLWKSGLEAVEGDGDDSSALQAHSTRANSGMRRKRGRARSAVRLVHTHVGPVIGGNGDLSAAGNQKRRTAHRDHMIALPQRQEASGVRVCEREREGGGGMSVCVCVSVCLCVCVSVCLCVCVCVCVARINSLQPETNERAR